MLSLHLLSLLIFDWVWCLGVLLHVFLLLFVLHTFAAVFAFAPNFNSDISKWDTSAVESMNSSKYSTKTIYFRF